MKETLKKSQEWYINVTVSYDKWKIYRKTLVQNKVFIKGSYVIYCTEYIIIAFIKK